MTTSYSRCRRFFLQCCSRISTQPLHNTFTQTDNEEKSEQLFDSTSLPPVASPANFDLPPILTPSILTTLPPDVSLENVEYADTKIFIPPIHNGKVVKVYDADTITVANRLSEYSPEVFRFNVRLLGIDTPEIKSKNATTKTRGIDARDTVKDMIFGKIVRLENVSLEKYGRLLADVYIGDIHLNQWLLDNHYAVKYDGGTKHIPAEWEA